MTICCDQLAFLQLARPAWLLWAFLAAGPPVVAVLRRRRERAVSPWSVAAQSLALLMLAVATAGPTARLGAEAQKPWLVLRDVSLSLRGQDAPAIEPDGIPTILREFGPSQTGPPRTQAAPALRLAAARADELAGVVIRTDGRFHDDWQSAADALGRTKLPVFIDPLQSPPRDARLAEFAADRRGRDVSLRLTVIANANVHRDLTVTRTGGDERVLLNRSLRLRAGEPASVRLTDDAPAGTFARYQAKLTPPDPFPENDSAVAAVLPVRGRVVVLGAADAVDMEYLRANSDRTVDVPASGEAPSSPDGWASTDTVVLMDPDTALPTTAARAALAEAVLAGTGLVVVGTVSDEGAPLAGDPLADVTPLTPDWRRRNPLKVAVALDASGSMSAPAGSGGLSMFDRAVEAVLTLRPQLTDSDSLAVLTFADEPSVAYDSGEGPADFAALRDALEPVTPGGPTHVLPVLERAVSVLASADDGRDRLLIVVSDLRTEQFEPAAVARMLDEQSVSPAIVLTAAGEQAQTEPTPLEQLADLTDAPLVTANRLEGLAEIFRRFLRDARGPGVRRGDFAVEPVGSPLGLSPFPLERLTAYVPCEARPRADVLARAEGDPVLAYLRAGLGRCVQLAVPPADVANSRRLSVLLSAALERTARPAADARFSGSVRHHDGRLHVRLQAHDADGPINNLSLHIRRANFDSSQERAFTAAMRQTGPGLYEADLHGGSQTVAVEVADENGAVLWREVTAESAPPEFSSLGTDWRAMRELAGRTRGNLVLAGGAERHMREATRRARTELWPVLVAASVALMLSEWVAHTLRSRKK